MAGQHRRHRNGEGAPSSPGRPSRADSESQVISDTPAVYFRNADAEQTLYRVALELGERVIVGEPEPLLTVGRDTRILVGDEPGRFLLISDSTEGTEHLGVITNCRPKSRHCSASGNAVRNAA